MKKQNVYSASDFASANVSVVVDDCFWVVDHVEATNVGAHSGLPLFEIQLRKAVYKNDESETLPDAFIDDSAALTRNRIYFVREKRKMYNELAEVWQALGEDLTMFNQYAAKIFTVTDSEGIVRQKAYRGHVVRLSGITYTKMNRDKSITSRSRLELWYPEEYDPETILDDFISCCNRGIYTPVVKEKPDPIAEALKNLDPAVIAAIKAMK